MILLSQHDDGESAADFLLSGIEQELELLGALPTDLTHFRDRMADIAERMRDQAINASRRDEVPTKSSTIKGLEQ